MPASDGSDFTVTVPDVKAQKIAVKVPSTGEKLRLQVPVGVPPGAKLHLAMRDGKWRCVATWPNTSDTDLEVTLGASGQHAAQSFVQQEMVTATAGGSSSSPEDGNNTISVESMHEQTATSPQAAPEQHQPPFLNKPERSGTVSSMNSVNEQELRECLEKQLPLTVVQNVPNGTTAPRCSAAIIGAESVFPVDPAGAGAEQNDATLIFQDASEQEMGPEEEEDAGRAAVGEHSSSSGGDSVSQENQACEILAQLYGDCSNEIVSSIVEQEQQNYVHNRARDSIATIENTSSSPMAFIHPPLPAGGQLLQPGASGQTTILTQQLQQQIAHQQQLLSQTNSSTEGLPKTSSASSPSPFENKIEAYANLTDKLSQKYQQSKQNRMSILDRKNASVANTLQSQLRELEALQRKVQEKRFLFSSPKEMSAEEKSFHQQELQQHQQPSAEDFGLDSYRSLSQPRTHQNSAVAAPPAQEHQQQVVQGKPIWTSTGTKTFPPSMLPNYMQDQFLSSGPSFGAQPHQLPAPAFLVPHLHQANANPNGEGEANQISTTFPPAEEDDFAAMKKLPNLSSTSTAITTADNSKRPTPTSQVNSSLMLSSVCGVGQLNMMNEFNKGSSKIHGSCGSGLFGFSSNATTPIQQEDPAAAARSASCATRLGQDAAMERFQRCRGQVAQPAPQKLMEQQSFVPAQPPQFVVQQTQLQQAPVFHQPQVPEQQQQKFFFPAAPAPSTVLPEQERKMFVQASGQHQKTPPLNFDQMVESQQPAAAPEAYLHTAPEANFANMAVESIKSLKAPMIRFASPLKTRAPPPRMIDESQQKQFPTVEQQQVTNIPVHMAAMMHACDNHRLFKQKPKKIGTRILGGDENYYGQKVRDLVDEVELTQDGAAISENVKSLRKQLKAATGIGMTEARARSRSTTPHQLIGAGSGPALSCPVGCFMPNFGGATGDGETETGSNYGPQMLLMPPTTSMFTNGVNPQSLLPKTKRSLTPPALTFCRDLARGNNAAARGASARISGSAVTVQTVMDQQNQNNSAVQRGRSRSGQQNPFLAGQMQTRGRDHSGRSNVNVDASALLGRSMEDIFESSFLENGDLELLPDCTSTVKEFNPDFFTTWSEQIPLPEDLQQEQQKLIEQHFLKRQEQLKLKKLRSDVIAEIEPIKDQHVPDLMASKIARVPNVAQAFSKRMARTPRGCLNRAASQPMMARQLPELVHPLVAPPAPQQVSLASHIQDHFKSVYRTDWYQTPNIQPVRGIPEAISSQQPKPLQQSDLIASVQVRAPCVLTSIPPATVVGKYVGDRPAFYQL